MKRIIATVLIVLLVVPPASAGQRSGKPLDWQIAQTLRPGTEVVLTVLGGQATNDRLLFADCQSPEFAAGQGVLQRAIAREALRLAQAPTAAQSNPTTPKRSWAARHKWATVGILAAVGVLAYGVIYIAANAD